MDMQIGIAIGIFLTLAVLIIYTISSYFSIKEDSFDEAKANRRKVIKEYFDQSRPSNDKPKNKKSKKAKKAKDKKPEPIVNEVEQKKEAAVVEAPKEMAVIKKPGPVSKAPPVKPKAQIPEKEELIVTPTVTAATADHTSKKNTDKKSKANKSVEKQPEQEPSPSPVPPKEPEKKPKVDLKPEKKKSDATNSRKQTGNEKTEISMSSIFALIRKAEFSKAEIQVLVDTLLTACEEENPQWLKVKKVEGRQESSVKLKKQLSEMEASLKNEKQITQGLQVKLKELRSEMASDKSSVTILKDQVNKIQQDKDELVYEKSDLLMRIKSLSDERDELQEQVDKEISKAQQQQKIDDDRHHETVLALKDQINHVSSQLEVLQTENASLKSGINYLETELKAHENCQDEIIGLKQALEGHSDKSVEKDGEIRSLRERVASLSAINKKIDSEVITPLKLERDFLSDEVERLKNEEKISKENGVSNGFDNGHDPINCRMLLEEKENLLLEASKERAKYLENISQLRQELIMFTNERDKLRALFEKSNSEIDCLKKQLANISDQSCEIKGTTSQLRNTINEKNDELNVLRLELDKYKQRNNELRNKNWKVVEALSTAEKALQSKLKADSDDHDKKIHKKVEDVKSSVIEFVHRLFPDVKFEDYNGHFNDWLRSVEELVVSNCMSHPELLVQNMQLQQMVVNYKNIIHDTEQMLNKLQNHVEVEESRWSEEMSCLQQEVENLRASQRNTS